MRRRSGFTLVEVLVSMGAILFIMSILAGAFGAASQAVSDLKAGDLAEKPRGATNVLKCDMEADHFTDSATPSKKLSDTGFWDRLSPGNTSLGFFRILQQQVDSARAPTWTTFRRSPRLKRHSITQSLYTARAVQLILVRGSIRSRTLCGSADWAVCNPRQFLSGHAECFQFPVCGSGIVPSGNR